MRSYSNGYIVVTLKELKRATSNSCFYLADTAVWKPEGVCIETFSITVEGHQPFLYKLLGAAGSESSWNRAQSRTLACPSK